MDNATLLRGLASHGVIHQEQTGFRGMVAGIENDARIVCAETKSDRGFSGISFWLYGEGENWYLGLWSGVYYKITDPRIMEQMIVDLMFGDVLPRRKVPFLFSETITRRYGLLLIEETETPKPGDVQ